MTVHTHLRDIQSDRPASRSVRPLTGKDFGFRLQVLQKLAGATNYCLVTLSGGGLASRRKFKVVLENWDAADAAEMARMLDAYGEQMAEHMEHSNAPLLWNGLNDRHVAETPDFSQFTRRLKARVLDRAGIAYPVRLGAMGNGYVIFTGPYIDLAGDRVIDIHGKCCQLMVDLLASEERGAASRNSSLSEREIACLQMAGDGKISEEIADNLGLSVHTVNAYLGAATTKLDSVNRIQAIAKALRLGYIR